MSGKRSVNYKGENRKEEEVKVEIGWRKRKALIMDLGCSYFPLIYLTSAGAPSESSNSLFFFSLDGSMVVQEVEAFVQEMLQ